MASGADHRSNATAGAADRAFAVAPVLLLWDIDGTLLSTARAGLFAFVAAAQEVLDRSPDLDRLSTGGLTDAAVAVEVIELCGATPDSDTVESMLRAYERELPGCLPLRKGRVLPGVTDILGDLADRDDVLSLLLTGNTEAGARAKLDHYGLSDALSEGAFCTGPGERDEIAARALELATERFGPGVRPRVFVIGDTPRDVACGKAIGALTIAVATGPASADELRAGEPWALLEHLPVPAEFRALVGIAVAE